MTLLRMLDVRSLAAWRSEIDAVDARVGQALQDAADADRRERAAGQWRIASRTVRSGRPRLRTTTVHMRRGTLPDEAAVREWLQEQEERLRDAVRHGPVIVR